MKQPIKVGKKIFATKKAMLAHYKAILNSYTPNESLNKSDFDDVFNLLLSHPDAKDKVGVGIEEIRVSELKFNGKI
ncbi:MAG: DUF3223 domain-containing protein [Methylophaga sp.]|nr:DUF3223 domain-containing protein [Methylophaga sp.]